jgi:formylglycine-generating enzyme required for sulfatase activity
MRPLLVLLLTGACNSRSPAPVTFSKNAEPSAVKQLDANSYLPDASGMSDVSQSPTSGSGSDAASGSVTSDTVAATATTEVSAELNGMLRVPGGEFTMGAERDGQEDERPAHSVRLRAFYLDRTEVTHAHYETCVTAAKCRMADKQTLERFRTLFVSANQPVSGISWDDARAYCTFKGKRLPREAEFERAVRGNDGRRFPWGNEPPSKERTVFAASHTEEVGTHPLGRGPYGHDDLAGNVWEWMEDNYDPFAYTRAGRNEGLPGTCDEILTAQNQLRREGKEGYTGSNPIPTECERSIRGGAYNYDANGLRSTNRVHHPGRFHLLMTGVRCAKDAE